MTYSVACERTMCGQLYCRLASFPWRGGVNVGYGDAIRHGQSYRAVAAALVMAWRPVGNSRILSSPTITAVHWAVNVVLVWRHRSSRHAWREMALYIYQRPTALTIETRDIVNYDGAMKRRCDGRIDDFG